MSQDAGLPAVIDRRYSGKRCGEPDMNKVILQILVAVVQWALVVIGAPLLIGFVRRIKARLQGRRGAGVLQPYRDLRKLLSKEVVISENTSWVFTLAPYVSFGTMLLAALI